MAPHDELAAIVLAAGTSSRMVRFKPLLPLGGESVLARAIGALRAGGVSDVTVVVGHRGEELRPAIDALGARCVVNAAFAGGMYTSVVAGIRALGPHVRGCFVLPADMPAVRGRTVALLAKAHRRTGAAVTFPTFRGQRGHPPLLSARLFPAIVAGDGEGGLRRVLAAREVEVRELAVIDEGILVDLDTPADYAAAARELHDRTVPTLRECEAILEQARAPEPVVRHGRCVSAVAGRIALALGEAGVPLDLPRVTAGGLLHDLARRRHDHARIGARRLVRLGFPGVARVVASHMDLAFDDGAPLDEAAVVFLADKLVRGDRVVSLADRFARARASAGSADAVRAVEARWAAARAVARELERVLGRGLRDVTRAAPDLRAGSASP